MPSSEGPPAYVLTIDVEPDGREDAVTGWEGFAHAAAILQRSRARLRERTGRPVAFHWFLRMDPQIAGLYGGAAAVVDRHRDLLRSLAAQGDAFGLHVHAFRPDGEGGWFPDHADALWVGHCIRTAVGAFDAALGRRACAFRFGDRFLSDAVVACLARCGIRYDLTLEPGQKAAAAMVAGERATGGLPDFRRAERRPYRPRRGNYLQPARRWWQARRLWLVPVATACVNGVPLPGRIGDEHDIVHLNLGLRREWVGLILDAVLGAREPVVVSVARTGDLDSRATRELFADNLEQLAGHALLPGRAVTTVERAVAGFRAAD